MSTHRKNLRKRQAVALVSTAALGLSLTACSSDDGAEDSGSAEDMGDQTITLGYLPSWSDGLTMAYLLDNQLSAAGYTVEHEEMTEAGILYTALAEGDIDVYPSAWSGLHADYIESGGDDLENLGAYYANASSFLAVPEYTDIDSLDELADNVDMFDGTITGIEPSAGLMEATADFAIPDYGLDEAGYTLQESSTAAMLTELGEAVDNEEDILVTMWKPFWANGSYPLKPLEDPQGSYGEAEELQFEANADLSEEQPEVADWLSQVKLDDAQYSALENSVVNEHEGDPAAGVAAWLEENPDVIPAFEG